MRNKRKYLFFIITVVCVMGIFLYNNRMDYEDLFPISADNVEKIDLGKTMTFPEERITIEENETINIIVNNLKEFSIKGKSIEVLSKDLFAGGRPEETIWVLYLKDGSVFRFVYSIEKRDNENNTFLAKVVLAGTAYSEKDAVRPLMLKGHYVEEVQCLVDSI